MTKKEKIELLEKVYDNINIYNFFLCLLIKKCIKYCI